MTKSSDQMRIKCQYASIFYKAKDIQYKTGIMNNVEHNSIKPRHMDRKGCDPWTKFAK